MPRQLPPDSRVRLEPLWLRVDRNRVKVAAFLGMFCAGAALAAELVVMLPYLLALLLVYGAIIWTTLTPAMHPLYADVTWLLARVWQASLIVGGTAACVAAAYAAHTLTRPLQRQLGAIGAAFVPLGEMMPTKNSLKDMAIAAGISMAPKLFAIQSDSVNAFLIARGSQRPICTVTTGLVAKLDSDEQRAVFANLLSRFRCGDVAWATAVSAMMAPVWKWRDADLSADDEIGAPKDLSFMAGDRGGLTYVSTLLRSPMAAKGGLALLLAGVWAFFTYAVAVAASEIVGAGHRRAQIVSSESGDAEGMLLLKDPAAMLRALRKAIEADNRVRMAVPMYAGLFYIWAGDDLADDEDPEWRRLDRLREVVGVDGIADAAEEMADAANARDALAANTPPPAPRIEDAG